jgi:hypothetical protein
MPTKISGAIGLSNLTGMTPPGWSPPSVRGDGQLTLEIGKNFSGFK